MSGIKKTTGVNVNQILGMTEGYIGISAIMNNSGVSAVNNANSPYNGKKMVFAGTPVTGNFENRAAAFTAATTTNNVSDAIGVLVHDVCVDDGPENITVMAAGVVNLDRCKNVDVNNVYTDAVKTALKDHIIFIKDN